MLSSTTKYHFIGIGGAGMSALATIALEKGMQVSGSDAQDSATLARLRAAGAVVHIGHKEEHIAGAGAVVVSTAIHGDNPELAAALKQGLPVLHRADVLAAFMLEQDGVGVAGAHGKTTTTSMLGLIFERCGADPTVIIGGDVDYLASNAKWGRGRYLLAEADESDGSFLKLSPQMAVITNIENDHMDHYGTMENVLQAFVDFVARLPETGKAVVCLDNENIQTILPRLKREVVTYGLERSDAEYRALHIRMETGCTTFEVWHKEQCLGEVTLTVPGRHNVSNALASIIVALEAGLPFAGVAAALLEFRGAKRRFQTKYRDEKVWIVDDYAHHPTEVATTLVAARQTQPKRLVCLFQPHRYSRTQLLYREFGAAFGAADVLMLTDVYSAGEAPLPGVNGEMLFKAVVPKEGQEVYYVQDKEALAEFAMKQLQQGDLIMTMGAGDIWRSGEELAALLQSK